MLHDRCTRRSETQALMARNTAAWLWITGQVSQNRHSSGAALSFSQSILVGIVSWRERYAGHRVGSLRACRSSKPFPSSSYLCDFPVRVDDKLVRDAGVEGLIALRRLVEGNHLDIDDVGDRQRVPQDRLHELPIVLDDRSLSGVETVGFCPAETQAKAEIAKLGCLLLCSRIFSHIQTGDADGAGRAGDLHEAIQHDSRRFDDMATAAVPLGLEPDAVDGAIDLRDAEDISDEFAQPIVSGQVDRLEADLLGMG